MKSHFKVFVLLFTALAAFSIPVSAQQNEDEEAALLPDIDPQNIEIRGEFRTRFPGLQRQPILGFAPNMRIYQVPDDRMPFMESGANVIANLPLSAFSRPAPPAYSLLDYSDINYMFARVGGGSYASSEASLWAAVPLSDNAYFGGDLDYSASSDGHLAERPGRYRYLTANLEFGTQLNETMDLYLHAGLQNDFNYSARFIDDAGLGEISRITYEGIHAGVELTHYKNEVTGFRLKGNIRNFTSRYTSESFPGTIDEMAYSGSFAYQWALGHPGETISIQAGGKGAAYETADNEDREWVTLQGGLVYERLFNYTTNIYAEAKVFYTSNYLESVVYPGGLLQISQWFGSRIKITGSVEGKPYLRTVEENFERNRFLGYNFDLRHSYAVNVNGEAAIKYYRGSRLFGGVTYLYALNYAYYVPQTGVTPVDGSFDFYTINYMDATNMKLYAGITHQLSPETFWISARAYLQNPVLSNDEAIPYHENWGLKASATFRPIERITIKGWTNYVADREPGLADTDLENIFLVGGQLDLRIIDGIGAYVKVINLLDQDYQYWQGYRERPLQIYGGLTIKL